MHEINA
jgi:hypothetical protein